MFLTSLLFYLFSFLLVSSSLVVVSVRSMVTAVMFLIFAFFNASALFLLIGAEFLAMLLVIVYVGAIAVLFLFVVMMLDADKMNKLQMDKKKPLALMLGLVMLCEIILIIKLSSIQNYKVATQFSIALDVKNTAAIGEVLYTDFVLPFQLCGAILFVAMIGAITLTLGEERKFVRKQLAFEQFLRNKSNSLEIVKVKKGEGIDL